MATDFETQFATSAWLQLTSMHGQTVTYYALNAGGGSSITAIWMPQTVSADWDEGGKDAMNRGTIQCQQSDISSPNIQDTFVISTVKYAVESIVQESPVIIMELVDVGQEYLGGNQTYGEG